MLYLSHYFKQHRTEYYDRLQAVRMQGAWEEWLQFFLRGVYQVSEEATSTARKILDLRESHRQLVMDKLGRSSGKALAVLESLYDRPVVSVHYVAETLGTSFAAANALVRQFVGLGVLTEMTGKKRNRVFVYSAYLDLFEDTPR